MKHLLFFFPLWLLLGVGCNGRGPNGLLVLNGGYGSLSLGVREGTAESQGSETQRIKGWLRGRPIPSSLNLAPLRPAVQPQSLVRWKWIALASAFGAERMSGQ